MMKKGSLKEKDKKRQESIQRIFPNFEFIRIKEEVIV